MEAEVSLLRHGSCAAMLLSSLIALDARGEPNHPNLLPFADYTYPETRARIGQGWSSFNAATTARTCVQVGVASLEKSSFETQVEHVQSSYSLITKTTTSANAAYNGYGVGASGSVTSSSSLEVSSDDQNFLFSFNSSDGSTFAIPLPPDSDTFELSDQAIKGLGTLKTDAAQQAFLSKAWSRSASTVGATITLTPEASAMLKNDSQAFAKLCGDGFVSAIHRGTRINVLLTQRYASRAEASSLAASLSASGYGASVGGTYSTSTQQLDTTNNLSFRQFQQGGVPMKPPSLGSVKKGEFFDVNSILPSADQVIGNPTAFTVTVTPYANILSDAYLQGVPIPSPAAFFGLSAYYLALRDLFKLVDGILNLARTGPFDKDAPF
jgi:hypothetical protein